VYIDNVFNITLKEEVNRLEKRSIEEFRWVSLEVGKLHSYLGMQLDFEKGCVKIRMNSYIKSLLEGFTELRLYQGLAEKKFSTADQQEKVLSIADLKCFHTVLAKLL
jgi:hypothetical protein